MHARNGASRRRSERCDQESFISALQADRGIAMVRAGYADEEAKMSDKRIERDSMGELEVPAEASTALRLNVR